MRRCVGLVVFQGQPMSGQPMSEWEYLTINIGEVPDHSPATAVLNDLGRDGWELVCIVANGLAYLKREVARPLPQRRRVKSETRAVEQT